VTPTTGITKGKASKEADKLPSFFPWGGREKDDAGSKKEKKKNYSIAEGGKGGKKKKGPVSTKHRVFPYTEKKEEKESDLITRLSLYWRSPWGGKKKGEDRSSKKKGGERREKKAKVNTAWTTLLK